jgi:hypothetical protein
MSKGLGTLQRRLIEISTATQTIWQASPDGVTVEVGDIEKKTAAGVTTQLSNGLTWRKTGEPYFEGSVKVECQEHFIELKKAFRHAGFKTRNLNDSLLSACWSMHHIRATLWPELWRSGDNREDLQHPRYRHSTLLQIPPAIKTARNAAQAGLSRAIASLEKRGMIVFAGSTHSDAANAIWRSHGATKFHCVSYITDGRLLKP